MKKRQPSWHSWVLIHRPLICKESRMSEKKYKGYGYHGGGRKPSSPDGQPRRTTMTISGTKSEIEAIRKLAMNAAKSVSRYVIERVLVDQEPFDYWDKELEKEASGYYNNVKRTGDMQDFIEGYIIGAQRHRPRMTI